MAKQLKDYTVTHLPEEGLNHIHYGATVAITQEGLRVYNTNKTKRNILIGAGLGLFALPFLIGGGIGLAMGGEAVGLGIAELGIIGSGTGMTLGKIVDQPRTGHLRKDKTTNLTFVNMVGQVIARKSAEDLVKVTWRAKDEYGKTVKFDAWHDVQYIYGLTA